MVWALIGALLLMVGFCMHLLARGTGWQERARDAEGVIAELWGASRTPQGYDSARSRLRWYCAKWGMVMTEDSIEEAEWK